METVIDKKFGKNVEKVLNFASFVEDYKSWYDGLNGREGYIVGDGRVYTWLGEDDVSRICTNLLLTPTQIEEVNQEFDEDRLNGIYQHVCSAESDYYTEWLAGCSYDDYRERARLYGTYLRYQKEDVETCYLNKDGRAWVLGKYMESAYSSLKYYHKEFTEYYKQGLTQDQVLKKYLSENAQEIKELDYLQVLKNENGKTWGGKYPSIAEERVVDISEEVHELLKMINDAEKENTNKDFFAVLKESRYWRSYDSVKELLDYIDEYRRDMTEMMEAVEFVSEHIESIVKKKNFKMLLVAHLEEEIKAFTETTLTVEEQVSGGVAKFNHIASIKDGIITTNIHACVTLIEAVNILALHNSGKDVVGMMVGAFKINKVFTIDDETYFKIGCHLIKLSEVSQKLSA